jgi:hypothetical protein
MGVAASVVVVLAAALAGVGSADPYIVVLGLLALVGLVGVPVWFALKNKRPAHAEAPSSEPDAPKKLPPLRPNEPIEEMFQHPDGELYLGVRRLRDPATEDHRPMVLRSVPMQWMGSAPARVRFTQDRPELFDPLALPAWDLPQDADTLVIYNYEGHEVATVPVPAGYCEIHVLVKRKTADPRVVVYLVPSGREA